MPRLRGPRVVKTVDPRRVDMLTLMGECLEYMERPGVVTVFQLSCLFLRHPEVPRMDMGFSLSVVKFPHDRFHSALHSVQSLVKTDGFRASLFFSEGTLATVRECVRDGLSVVQKPEYDPWRRFYLHDRGAIAADMKASYTTVFHEALEKRRQELSDGQRRRPPMRTVSAAPKEIPVALPAIMHAAASTSVFDIPSINKKTSGGSEATKQIPKRQSEVVIAAEDRPGPSSAPVTAVASGSAVPCPKGKERKTRSSQKGESSRSPLLKGKKKSKKSKKSKQSVLSSDDD